MTSHTQTGSSTLDAVSSFLPELLITPLNSGLITQDQATYKVNFHACLLFADISGFTALAEKFDQEGTEGAEKLTLVLNRYFGGFIDIVNGHGGDIAKFAGDALLAVWPIQNPEERMLQARQVQACGMALQSFMSSQTIIGPEKLKMKVAVSMGNLRMVCIGGLLNRREMILASQALAELGFANDQASAGELIVCPSIKPFLENQPPPSPLTAHSSRSLLMENALATGLEFIPAAIRKSLNAKQDDWINENRQVSIIFVNLSEFADQLPVELIQQCMISLQRSLYSVEGSVNKISVDDKGVSLMGVLGMPPFTHADDPQRALQSAILMHKELCELNIKHQIGISTGTVFCGVVGNSKRREYTIMGDAVNLSARLMQKTRELKTGLPILIDENTASTCLSQFELTKFASVQLKGKTKPMTLFQPSENLNYGKFKQPPQTIFVGRQKETKTLKETLNQHKGGMIIKGPAGIGRSSLIRACVKSGNLAPLAIEQTCTAVESKLPWQAWQTYFRVCFQIDPAMPGEQIRRLILSQLHNQNLYQSAPLIEAVIPCGWEDNEYTKELSGDQRAAATLIFLKNLVQRLDSLTPSLIVFYNVEWLDTFSLNLLLEVLDGALTHPILMTTTPEKLETHQSLSALEEHQSIRIMELGPLSDDEVIELSRSRAKIDDLPEPVKRLILDRAGGSPLFVLQATEALLESEWLTHDCQGNLNWNRTASISETALPHSLDGLIISRIDRLDPDIQLTSKVASVIGTDSTSEQIKGLHPMQANDHTIFKHIQALQSRGLAYKTPIENTLETTAHLRFNNDAITTAFYKLLPGFQRRDLHYKLANLYEKTLDSSLPSAKTLIAYHFERACDTGNQANEVQSLNARKRACELYLELAHRAIQLGASAEAEAGFQTTLKLVEKQNNPKLEELEVDTLLGLSTVRSTRYGWADAEAAKALEQALKKSTNSSQKLKVFQSVRGLWQVKVANSEYQKAMNLALELEQKAKQSANSPHGARMQAEAKRALGTTHFWIGNFEESQLLLNESLQTLSNLNLKEQSRITLAQDTEVSARGILAWAYALQDRDILALDQAHKAVEISESIDSAFTKAYARGAAMWTCLHISNVHEALAFSDQTLEISREHGYDYFTTAALVVKGWSNAWNGDEHGIEEIANAIRDWQAKGQVIGVPAFLLQQARALERFNRLHEAVEILKTPVFVDTLPKEPWIEHLVRKMLGSRLKLTFIV